MGLRLEVYTTLEQQARNGGIHRTNGEGKKAEQIVRQANVDLLKARYAFLAQQFPAHFRMVVFGSARLGAETDEYRFMTGLAKEVVMRTGADIITGGGPGIMEAALLGAEQADREAKQQGRDLNCRRIGVNIRLPFEQGENPYVQYSSTHDEFLSRLQEFADRSHIAYFAPGGIGTATELHIFLQLKQVGYLEPDFKLIAHPFWRESIEAYRKAMYHDRVGQHKVPLIGESDLDIVFSDTIPDIVGIVRNSYQKWNETIGSHVVYQEPSRRNVDFGQAPVFSVGSIGVYPSPLLEQQRSLSGKMAKCRDKIGGQN